MKTKLITEPITSDYGASLLRARGIKDVQAFLNPTLENLSDWHLLDNCKLGAKILGEILI